MISTMSVYFADQFAIIDIALVIVSVQINKFLTPDGWVKINLSQGKKREYIQSYIYTLYQDIFTRLTPDDIVGNIHRSYNQSDWLFEA